MTPDVHGKLRIRIFVEERKDGMVWVPYKTLIGYNIMNRPILGRLWEPIYGVKKFASKSDALEEAKRRAWVRVLELFGHVLETDAVWEVIHERGPELVGVTYEDASGSRRKQSPPPRYSGIDGEIYGEDRGRTVGTSTSSVLGATVGLKRVYRRQKG